MTHSASHFSTNFPSLSAALAQEEREDLIDSLELMLNQNFQGAALSEVVAATQARIDELAGPAKREGEFDVNSLERGMLQKLLAKLTGEDLGQGAPAGVTIH